MGSALMHLWLFLERDAIWYPLVTGAVCFFAGEHFGEWIGRRWP